MRIAPIALAASISAILVFSSTAPAETTPPSAAQSSDALQRLGLSLVGAMPRDGNSVVSPFSLGAALDLIAIGGNDAVRTAVGLRPASAHLPHKACLHCPRATDR
jgi:hypothetical protein